MLRLLTITFAAAFAGLLTLASGAATLSPRPSGTCQPSPTTSTNTAPPAPNTVAASTPDIAGHTGTTPGCPDATTVLTRAAAWLTAWNGGPVPYSMSTDRASLFDGYRRDCSGYVSMALGLPGPGLDTTALAADSTPISPDQLQPGDLLINPAPGGAGHVVIFDRWADPATRGRYYGYEQSGDGGTHHRLIPYPYYGNDARFTAYHHP